MLMGHCPHNKRVSTTFAGCGVVFRDLAPAVANIA